MQSDIHTHLDMGDSYLGLARSLSLSLSFSDSACLLYYTVHVPVHTYSTHRTVLFERMVSLYSIQLVLLLQTNGFTYRIYVNR